MLKSQLDLIQELSKEHPNVEDVLSLMDNFLSSDSESLRFSVDAGIVDRLGKELVTKQETALSELIKNCYDADATEVNVYFIDCSEGPGGEIVISDNGNGMGKEQLLKGFMRISSTDKIHNPTSYVFKRKRAGRKGIGRFSAQRLGARLVLVTQTKEADRAIRLTINWDDFKSDKNISSIPTVIEDVKKIKEHGTELRILGVRERWDESSIRRAYNSILSLLQPFPLSNQTKTDSNDLVAVRQDPGFHPKFFLGYGENEIQLIDNQTPYKDFALAEITGEVNGLGRGFCSVKSSKYSYEEKKEFSEYAENENYPFRYLKDINFKAYYFIYEAKLLPSEVRVALQAKAREFGGIKLYHNGFRVSPYGEKGDDWLGLDESVGKRQVLPVHGNNNFFGFVEINDNNTIFQESSSREGLLEGPQFEELKDFIYRSIIFAILAVARLRGVKEKNKSKKKNPRTLPERISSVITKFERLTPSGTKGTKEGSDEQQNSNNEEEFQKIIGELKQIRFETKDMISELHLTRVLAALGLTITQFVHEIKHYIPAIKIGIENLADQSGKSDSIKTNYKKELLTIVDGFVSYTSFFDHAVSHNVLRELQPVNIRHAVETFRESIEEETKKSQIDVSVNYRNLDIRTIPMHISEWYSILMNLYTNSKKAIYRSRNKGKICIDCGLHSGKVFMEFSDTGDGIPIENRSKVFDAFFTTTGIQKGAIDSYSEIVGTGLGLKIVSDIIASYGGKIEVIEPRPGFSTTIRLEVPGYAKQ